MDDEEPKAIEGEIIPKDVPLPMEKSNHHGQGPLSSLARRAGLYAQRKEVEAHAALQAAEAELEATSTERLVNAEAYARQKARLTDDNLEKMAQSETSSITAELDESLARQKKAKAAKKRQKDQDEVEDLELQLKKKRLMEQLHPKEPEPKKSLEERRREHRKKDEEFKANFAAEIAMAGGNKSDIPPQTMARLRAWQRSLTAEAEALDGETDRGG